MRPNANAKNEMLSLLQKGEFGNFLGIVRIPLLRWNGWYTLRNRERDSPYFVPTVRGCDVPGKIKRLVAQGAQEKSIYIQDIPSPDSRRLIQGELAQLPCPYLTYSLHPTLNLRDALDSSPCLPAQGIMVKSLISQIGGLEAWEDLEALMHKYPDHTTEFTVFDRPTGQLHRQAVIWEVRSY